ncbi:MAG: 16S rRNA (cytosine(967)-C(5))-methyltransferase RsmB [Phascolarctobacterium sp.]|nr:16S rRNA (cytosine(967)-C(5))-methyltransferase RsmB [Phascolarctobacterium sp.]
MAKIEKKATARSGAVEILQQVLNEGAYTNIAVNKYLRSHSLSDMERRLLTELVYGTVKAVGTIDWYLAQCVTRPLDKIDKLVLNILRVSVYQLLYMDKIPVSAACNEAVNLARLFSHEGTAKFVNGVLRGLLRKKDSFTFPDEGQEAADYISLKMYHPRWLVKKWLKNYGREATEALCAFDNTPAPVCLRVNTLVTTRDKLVAELTKAGGQVRASKWSADGIVCDKLPALSEVFANLHNAFYVQDESSMLVGAVLAPRAGETVIDMCSAPGGKTTHLAQLMQNEGIIYAGDVHEHKIKLIEENAARLGIKIIKAQLQDATQFVEAWEQKADKVLVDAPCSGMGVLRRRAEARWRKTRNDLKIFPPLQLKILNNAARYVKAGGTLVYSTCTIEQAENHYLVQEFLAANPEWHIEPFPHPLTGELVEELQLLPQVDNVDGFYICKLKKK